MTWNERKSEMSEGEEKPIEDRLRVTENVLKELSVKIDEVRDRSVGIIKDLRSVHTEMKLAIDKF
jgi:hypothetical protein